MPKSCPRSRSSISTLMVVALASIASPRANVAAKRMPIEVSVLRPARRLTVLTSTATEIPVGTAAMAGLKPTYEPKHHSRQHGVGESVPHEGEVPGDDVRADQRAHNAHKHRADQGSHHEAVLEWADKEVYHVVLLPLSVHSEAHAVCAV